MKKQLLLIIYMLIAGVSANATHLMGGQMTSRNLGGLTYEVTLTVYRDTVGVPIFSTVIIRYDSANVNIITDTVPVSIPYILGNGVEKYFYIDTVSFAAAGTYELYYNDCCRNGAILNMSNPTSERFYIGNTLLADSTNSSPMFLNEPIILAQLNTPFNYNPLPFDSDGDSISWALDIPLSNDNFGNPDTVANYILPSSDTLMPFTMNSATGEISFLPNILGYYAVSVLVSEYRNGLKIGEIRRDMEIIVQPSGNRPANITMNSTNAPFTGRNYTIVSGTAFNFTVIANDLDGNTIDFTANGEPFRLANNPATFTSVAGAGLSTASLSWIPAGNSARTQPYIIGLRVNEPFDNNLFSNDISVLLRVAATTGIDHASNSDVKFNVYPNPVSDYMMLDFTSKSNTDARVEIINLAGQSVKVYEAVKVVNGLNVIQVKDLNLNAGVYIVNLIQDGNKLGTSKVNIR